MAARGPTSKHPAFKDEEVNVHAERSLKCKGITP